MKFWDISGDGRSWSLELDVRDLGGHLDYTWRARLFLEGLRMLLMVLRRLVRCLWGFRFKLGFVRGKYLLAGLHAVEASCVFASSLSAVLAAVV